MSTTKPFKATDLYRHGTLQALHGSPAHTQVVFTRTRPSRKQDAYRSATWRLDIDAGPPQRLTSADFGASSPRLSPDGAVLAFLSSRGHKASTQIHLLPMRGGEARRLTGMTPSPQSIDGWLPDGSALLVSAPVKWAEDEHDDTELAQSERPIVVTHLPYKMDGGGPTVGKRTHLFRVDATTGEATQLTRGDCDVKEARWSPDGRRLAFTRTREQRQRHRVDLWIADASGGNARRMSEHLAAVTGLQWSPDGTRLVFGGNRNPGDSLDTPWLLDVASGRLTELGGRDLHLEGSHFVWHTDGERVATIESRRGMQEIAILHTRHDQVQRFPRRLRHVLQLGQAGERLVLAVATMRHPEDLHSCTWEGTDKRRHTSFNRRWIRRRPRPKVTVRRFDVPDGKGGTEPVDAWLLRPAGNGPFPVLVDMHGGPQSAVLVDYPSHAYWYDLLSRGWMIVAPNTVGSGGYGTGFAKRLVGHWGELDLPQHVAILAQLREAGLADDRIACTGKSYGGFLAAWAIGHSEVFRAAVISAPIANVESHAGTSDTGFYVTPYAMGGEIDEVRERYHRLSPIEYCERAKAAVLILQGQEDERCPLSQSEELFANLVRCSRSATRMVVYPGGSHGLASSGRPSHRVDYHRRVADWVVRHAGSAESAAHASQPTSREPAQAQASVDSA